MEGNYLIGETDFVNSLSPADLPPLPDGTTAVEYFFEEESKVGDVPWKREDHPLIARWMDANEKPLELVIGASRRSQYFAPLFISDDDALFGRFGFPLIDAHRTAAQLLGKRALLKLGEGQVESAWNDLHACRRLARLSAQGLISTDGSIAMAVDGIGSYYQVKIVEHAELTAQQCLAFRRQLGELPAFPSVDHYVEPGERFAVLDLICKFAQLGTELPVELEKAKREDLLPAASNNIDWNVVLRTVNAWRDRFTAAATISDESKRWSELRKVSSELRAEYQVAKERAASIAAELSPHVAGEAFGVIAAQAFLSTYLGPPAWQKRVSTTDDLLKIALAIAQFKAEHGKLPGNLAVFEPTYFEKVPLDPATGASFVYRVTDKGYILYGLGPNGQDDGGKTYDDNDAGTTLNADDAVIEIPPRPRPKPAPPATDASAIEGEEAMIVVE